MRTRPGRGLGCRGRRRRRTTRPAGPCRGRTPARRGPGRPSAPPETRPLTRNPWLACLGPSHSARIKRFVLRVNCIPTHHILSINTEREMLLWASSRPNAVQKWPPSSRYFLIKSVMTSNQLLFFVLSTIAIDLD